ncbi:MAG: extracellular solute-binding protein, partial [Candidatus Omnitrophica bacterium]|nr:extracellular solute-binding protein [Candidatus Omnitrophota bacterium]
TIEGIKFYVDLIHKHKVAPAPLDLGNLGIGAQQLFISGRLAMFSSGIWETPILRKIKDFDWDVAMFPKGPTGMRGFGTGGSAYCILKTTKHPREAWEVIKCLAGRESQIMLAEGGLAQPAIRDISEGEHWARSPKKPLNKKMLNEAVKYVTYEPFHPGWREIQDLYIGQEFDLVFNGTERVEDAVGKILPKINELLRTPEG